MVLDISGTLFTPARPPGPVHGTGGSQRSGGMTNAWNDHYRALYDRTYRALYDAGVTEKLADELATQRTMAAALRCSDAHKPPLLHGSGGAQYQRQMSLKGSGDIAV